MVAGYQKLLLTWSVFKGLGEGWRKLLTLNSDRQENPFLPINAQEDQGQKPESEVHIILC